MPRVKLVFPNRKRRSSLEAISTLPSFSLAVERRTTGIIRKLLFSDCAGCLNAGEMCSIPQGVFVAHQVRFQIDKCVAAQAKADPNILSEEFETIGVEQPLLKYNSKLMNSIWGLYNRYSVHNFKKNTDGLQGFDMQHDCQIADDCAAPLASSDDVSQATFGNAGFGVGNNPPPLGGALGSCRSFVIKTLRAI